MNVEDESIEGSAGRDHVGSLARGLSVLEILAAHPSGLTLTEMAEKAQLTRAGARRFLLTLTASGYAVQSGRKFMLSSRLLSTARIWITGQTLWTYAEPFMRDVSGRLNESCSAAVLADEDVVYVARVAAQRILSVALHVGTRLPAVCTAMGRVLLSGLSPEELERFLAKARIEARTPKTITDRAELASVIADIRGKGYATMDEELEIGLRSIAAPIHDQTGAIVAAINVSTQSARYSISDMEQLLLPHLQQAASSIEDYFVVH